MHHGGEVAAAKAAGDAGTATILSTIPAQNWKRESCHQRPAWYQALSWEAAPPPKAASIIARAATASPR